MQTCFKKRIFTPHILASDIRFMLKNIRRFAAVKRKGKLSHAFLEKIMTVVTAVNGCVYCSWFHAREATAAGVNESEINDLFQLQFETKAEAYELPALMYAQHFAETARHPDAQETAAFVSYYGAETAGDIMLFIRMILLGNLAGNTYDAFRSRLKGCPAPDSNALFEFGFFLLAFPLMFPASIMMKRQHRNEMKTADKTPEA